ncbi:MAG TPA: c-type cytochrome [Woeseiaceae bacterium]|jgi:sulfide dehydrogenase cytochrome subunit|nr:c-type cytochrome [Woeseiaceae bacterium]
MIRKTLYLFSALLLVPGIAAADVDALMQGCNDCHGDNGVSQWSDVPSIAGIPEFVHSDALYVYVDAARPCLESEYRQGDTSRAPTDMCAVAADLSADEIDAVAAAYAELPWVSAAQDFDVELAAKGQTIHEDKCDMCHSDGGSNPDDEASILAGQQAGYLETTFAQYLAGERAQPSAMQKKLDGLSADDITALVHFYASQQ